MNDPEMMQEMLMGAKTIAVIGLSDNQAKASFGVSSAMQRLGYRIIGVNPVVQSVLGERCYASLTELVAVEGKPDIVNVFRQAKFVPAVVEEMIALGLKNLWVQLGIVNEEAATKAETAGIRVVMDRCVMVERNSMALR
jgi:predicted CoA-binding protein